MQNISLADRTHITAVISHQVLDVLCHLCGEKKHLLYQQTPKFSCSLIDMCKGYDHQKEYTKKIVSSIIELICSVFLLLIY